MRRFQCDANVAYIEATHRWGVTALKKEDKHIWNHPTVKRYRLARLIVAVILLACMLLAKCIAG